MIIVLQREPVDGQALHGTLTVDGVDLGVSLENAARRIPAGKYPLELYYSQKNEMTVPLLVDVPGRHWIEMHPANYWSELEGCIAPAMTRVGQTVEHSRVVVETLVKLIRAALRTDPKTVWIDVRDAPDPEVLYAL
jgi:hypothetical protein